MSSAGVYKKSMEMPHFEVDAIDPKSRHKGKLETEDYCKLPQPSMRSLLTLSYVSKKKTYT
jgi:hypothetical protein